MSGITWDTRWYLWATDDNPKANEYFVQVVGEQNPEYLRRGVLCADGKTRNLFLCPRGYEDVKVAIAAAKEHTPRFEVFKEDAEDVVVRYDLWKMKVRKRARDGRRARELHLGSAFQRS